MNVSAIIVTRGNVDLAPCWATMPDEWEKIVWDNSKATDLSVYGRYAAIELASHDLIYVQDDDVIVSDPQAIVQAWRDSLTYDSEGPIRRSDHLVANMPQEFRHDFYVEHCLVGFGACFHRKLPDEAFALMMGAEDIDPRVFTEGWEEMFNRCCDIVFTALTPKVLVDVPKQDREFASDPDRMWKQPWHHGERQRMLNLVGSIA